MAAADEAASSASPCRSLETLERELAVTLGTEYAIVTGSGRSALEIALRSLTDRGAGGTVLCSNFTCAIVPQTIAKSGLRAALVDISEDLSFNVDSIRELPADCRGMVLNYLYGCPIDNLERVRDFVRRHGLFLIEDVAQSFGASLNGAPAGSAGDMGVFSFTKVFFDLPRGGCLVTNRSELATRARAVRSQIEAPFPTEAVRMAYRLTDAVGWRLGRLKERVWPAPDPFTSYQGRPYTYFEESHPSTYWALSRDEADSCLSTLRALDSAKRERSRLVKTMIQRIDADLGGLFARPLFAGVRLFEGSADVLALRAQHPEAVDAGCRHSHGHGLHPAAQQRCTARHLHRGQRERGVRSVGILRTAPPAATCWCRRSGIAAGGAPTPPLGGSAATQPRGP